MPAAAVIPAEVPDFLRKRQGKRLYFYNKENETRLLSCVDSSRLDMSKYRWFVFINS